MGSALTERLSQPLNAPAQDCGNLVLEALVTEREAAICRASDFFQIFFAQFELNQAPVCRSPLLGCHVSRIAVIIAGTVNLTDRPVGRRSIAGLGLTRQIEDFSPLPAVIVGMRCAYPNLRNCRHPAMTFRTARRLAVSNANPNTFRASR